jgi:hypothetical protein
LRRLVLVLVAAAAGAVTLASPASASPHCYTLGVPGQDAYQYCTYLPVDPNGILR